MFVCLECVGKPQYSTGIAYVAHIQTQHSQLLLGGRLLCTHNECFQREFNLFNSFRKHVLTHRKTEKVCSNSHPRISSNTISEVNNQCVSDETELEINLLGSNEQLLECEADVNQPVHPNSLDFDAAVTNSVVTYIATLYDSGLTETQIQTVIDSHISLLGGTFLTVLKEKVLSVLAKNTNSDSDKEVREVTQMFDSVRNMFEGFHTQHLRMSEFERCGAYIEPKPYVIGPAQTERNADGQVVIEPIELMGQFVPFRYVLKGFLELPGVLKTILDYMDQLEKSFTDTGVIENVIQAKLWRERIKPKFPGKTLLPLTFNFDDFECNNPLGSHAGVHKMGGGYVRIPCLPPQFLASLENICLVLLFHSADKVCGIFRLFRKVLSELKFLEDKGIEVVTSDGVTHVYFALCLVIGDNLGANEILGLVECFLANHFCRVCSEHKSITMTQVVANPDKRRTHESYISDLQTNNVSLTGRKGPCHFNQLKAYDGSDNVHVEIMHDVDEGVLKYLMCAIITLLISKGRFTLEYLNELIQGFYYGPNEDNNRPHLITMDHIRSGTIKASASEMRCLFRYFGLMVGHLIKPEDQDVWQLYLTARKILDIITAPRVTQAVADQLRDLIRVHHSEYQRIFKVHLKPKFHFLIHEPDLLIQNGPADPISTIRVEAKHKETKDIAHNSHNRLNLPLTAMKRHQMKFAFRLLAGRGLVPKFQIGHVQTIPFGQVKNSSNFASVVPFKYASKPWNVVKYVETNGMKYSVGSVVVLSRGDESPQFAQIKVINVSERNDVNFVLKLLTTILFDDHFHSYEVTQGNNWEYRNINSLLTHVATDIRIGVNGKRYVPFRFSLQCF